MDKQETEFIYYEGSKNDKQFQDVFNKYWYNNILNQSHLVDDLLKGDPETTLHIPYDDIQNIYMTSEQVKEDFAEELEGMTEQEIENEIEEIKSEHPEEIYEWYLITDSWLFDWLKENNEVVVITDYGDFWGRCTTGQSIVLDYIFAQFYNYIINK